MRLRTVIHWPEGGLVGGGKWDGLCGSLDMFPTLMAMTGSTMPQTRPLDRKNIWPALRDGQKSPVESYYWVWRDEDAIRTDKAQPKDRLAIAVANWSGTQYATDWIEFDIAFSPDAPKRRPYFSPLEGNNQKPFGPLFKPGTGVDQLGRDQSTGPAIADGESTWEHRIVGLSSTAPGPLGKHGVVFTGGTAGTFTVYLNQHSPPRLHREPGIRLPALHVGVLFAFPYQRGLRQNSIYKSMLQGAAGCLEQAAPATASSSALDC